MNTLWLEAVSGEPQYLWNDFRKEYLECKAAWWKFAGSIGAISIYAFPFEPPHAFKFPEKRVPEGWKVGTSRSGSQPYAKRLDLWAPIEALPVPPRVGGVAEKTGLPTTLRYVEPPQEPGGFGPSGSIGVGAGLGFDSWHPAWADEAGSVFVCGGDWIAEAAKYEASGAEVTLTPHDTREIPDGYRVVTKEYVDMIFAQAKYAASIAKE